MLYKEKLEENEDFEQNLLEKDCEDFEEDYWNKQTVRICLENIKKFIPFFLCLIGWIPQISDIDEETLIKFLFVKDYTSKLSVTEMKVYYALKECKHR